MDRTLTKAGFGRSGGGGLDGCESKWLDGKIQLILIVAIIGVLAPAMTRLILGS